MSGPSMTDAECLSLLSKVEDPCRHRNYGRMWAVASWLCTLAAWMLLMHGVAASFQDMFGGPPPAHAKYEIATAIGIGLLAVILGAIAMVRMIRENCSIIR